MADVSGLVSSMESLLTYTGRDAAVQRHLVEELVSDMVCLIDGRVYAILKSRDEAERERANGW